MPIIYRMYLCGYCGNRFQAQSGKEKSCYGCGKTLCGSCEKEGFCPDCYTRVDPTLMAKMKARKKLFFVLIPIQILLLVLFYARIIAFHGGLVIMDKSPLDTDFFMIGAVSLLSILLITIFTYMFLLVISRGKMAKLMRGNFGKRPIPKTSQPAEPEAEPTDQTYVPPRSSAPSTFKPTKQEKDDDGWA